MRRRLKKIKFIRRIYTWLQFLKWKCTLIIDGIRYKKLKQNPLWVETTSINLKMDASKVPYKKKIMKKYGVVYNGNWDLYVENMSEYDLLISFKQRFLCGQSWTETELYNRVLKQINLGWKRFDCKTEEEWNEHLTKTDKLFDKIKNDGYKSQKKLKTMKKWDEIRVAVSRNKEIIFLDGRHRLAIAKVLGIHKIPVNICVIHPLAYTKQANSTFIYQRI